LRLHTYYRSTAAYRVRIALNLKRLPYEPVYVHLTRGGGEHKTPAFRELNPQGLVPVLEDDGVALSQSLAIIEYLDRKFPEPQLIPDRPVDRARVQSFAQAIACDVHPLNNLRVLQYLRDRLKADETQVSDWYGHWVAEAFRGLETFVERYSGGRYAYGDGLTLADVYLVPQVFNARRFECDMRPYPRLSALADSLGGLEAFAKAAPAAQADAE